MPDPRGAPGANDPVPQWPDTLPNPQADGFSVRGPPRAHACETLFGPTRLQVSARTAPMEWRFTVWMSPEEFTEFEAFYRNCVEHFDGEFYARWIGGGRVLAFSAPYEIVPLGKGYALGCVAISTRIDPGQCAAHIEETFGAIYQADLAAADHYQADLSAVDTYRDDWDLQLIADNEC